MSHRFVRALFVTVLFGIAAFFAQGVSAQRPSVTVTVDPEKPFVEHRHHQKVLNFDLFVANHTDGPIHLVAIRMSAYARDGKLTLMRELNGNGHPPALPAVGPLTILPGQTVDYFQPFEELSEELDVFRLHFELLFMADHHRAAPVPFDADFKQELDVIPQDVTFAAYCLPLGGTVLVHDGHDLYSHHRRRAADTNNSTSLPSRPNQFAWDFVIVDADGELVHGDKSVLRNWLTYEQAVRAPAAGTVIAARGDLPENTLRADGTVVGAPDSDLLDPEGFGNRVVIRHSDGRYSWILHLKAGSLRVRQGQHVSAGQPLGLVGFSGDALFPHVHYMATDSASYPSRGMPTYFIATPTFNGSSPHMLQLGTGDIISANVNDCPGRTRQGWRDRSPSPSTPKG